jgi:hypothetical protein
MQEVLFCKRGICVLLLIESKDEISQAQRRLESTIRRNFTRKVAKGIGYPGGSRSNVHVFTDGKHWYWPSTADPTDSNPRRLNWFGLFKENTGLGITVEINTPYEGRNDKIAGFFARDMKTDAVYLMHSGRVGGGRKGVGKTEFLKWRGELVEDVVDNAGDIRKGVLVMPVEGVAASRSAIRYIDAIARFKKAVGNGELNTPAFRRQSKHWRDFYSEGSGRRKGIRSKVIDYLSRHGEVVDELRDWRTNAGLRKGERIVKSVFVDMGVEIAGKRIEVFEVKTSTDRSDVYAAIGQLLVHGGAANCRRVIVLPKTGHVASDLLEALRRVGIEVLRFKLDVKGAAILASRRDG